VQKDTTTLQITAKVWKTETKSKLHRNKSTHTSQFTKHKLRQQLETKP